VIRRRDAPLALEDVLAVTRCAAALSRAGVVDETAAAWLARNRARHALALRRAAAPDRDGFGDGSLSAAAASLLRQSRCTTAGLSDARLLRAAAAVCTVLCDLATDPTGGGVNP
jgi:hypothetical protein